MTPNRRSGRFSRMGATSRRLGLAAFLFFLVKGLLWLAIPLIGLQFL